MQQVALLYALLWYHCTFFNDVFRSCVFVFLSKDYKVFKHLWSVTTRVKQKWVVAFWFLPVELRYSFRARAPPFCAMISFLIRETPLPKQRQQRPPLVFWVLIQPFICVSWHIREYVLIQTIITFSDDFYHFLNAHIFFALSLFLVSAPPSLFLHPAFSLPHSLSLLWAVSSETGAGRRSSDRAFSFWDRCQFLTKDYKKK